MNRFRQAWTGWRRFARGLGEFQSRVLLTLLYAVLVIPVGLVLRLACDPLGRRRPSGGNWQPRAAVASSLEEARRQ